MPAGTATPGHTNRPDLARVTGTGQLIAHLSARALAMTTMHPVDIVGHAPLLQMKILGEQQPCLQAAAFRGKQPAEAVLAILNICNTTIPVTLEGGGSATVYDLTDPGGKAGLPAKPDDFPWPEPLHATTEKVPTSGVYTTTPLSFAIVELPGTQTRLKADDVEAVFGKVQQIGRQTNNLTGVLCDVLAQRLGWHYTLTQTSVFRSSW